MLRRTLLCAILACPLAAASLMAALLLRAVCAMLYARRFAHRPWYAPSRRSAALRKTAASCGAAMILSGLAYAACAAFFEPIFAPAYKALIFLTSLLLEAFFSPFIACRR